MQRENQWSANRGYLQHLDVLKRISTRNLHHRKLTLQRHPHSHEHDDPKVFERSAELARPKDTAATFREQQILWENYHLGKRIIETPPVISKRKLDEDYQRHRRLVDCLTSGSSRKVMPCEFRVKKLQEYKENVEQQQDERMQSAARNLIRLQIDNLAFYRQRPALDNLDLLLAYSSKSGKTHRQTSERFPAEELLEKHFYFGVARRLMSSQEALTVEIRNLKGLAVLSIGHFSFPSAQTLNSYKAQVFHCGKPIAEVELSTAYARRQPHCRTSESHALS